MKRGCGDRAGIRFRNGGRKNRHIAVRIGKGKIGAHRLRRPFEWLQRIVGVTDAKILPAKATFSTVGVYLFLVTPVISRPLSAAGRTTLVRLTIGVVGPAKLGTPP